MITMNPGDYDLIFPWRKYMIDPDGEESVQNLQPDTPNYAIKALESYLKENGDVRID